MFLFTLMLQSKIESGEYVLGEMIVPQSYKKVSLTKNGIIKTETLTVSGRKIPLSEIRERLLMEHEKMGLIRASDDEYYAKMTAEQTDDRLSLLDEHHNLPECATLTDKKDHLKQLERTRHLMLWADNSTLLNHGHLLLTVNVVYDEAFFFTNKEMKEQGKGNVDIQSLVERPHVYILARCGSSEAEQLMYIHTRKSCLLGLSNKLTTCSGVEVTDVMRLYHADGPEQDFESGEQKGGNAGCSGCSGDARKYSDLSVSLAKPYLSLTDRLRKVREGPAGRSKRNGGVKPFQNLRIDDLRKECEARGLPTDGLKKDLLETFREEMGGIQRVPAMMFCDQEKTLKDINLGMDVEF